MASRKIVTSMRKPKVPKVIKSKPSKVSKAQAQGKQGKESLGVSLRSTQKAAKPRAGRPLPKFEV